MGFIDGPSVGFVDGPSVGFVDGPSVGFIDGKSVGGNVGRFVGRAEGDADTITAGGDVGCALGKKVLLTNRLSDHDSSTTASETATDAATFDSNSITIRDDQETTDAMVRRFRGLHRARGNGEQPSRDDFLSPHIPVRVIAVWLLLACIRRRIMYARYEVDSNKLR